MKGKTKWMLVWEEHTARAGWKLNLMQASDVPQKKEY